MVALGLSRQKLSNTKLSDSCYQRYNILGAFNTMSWSTQTGLPSNNEFLAGSHEQSHHRRAF